MPRCTHLLKPKLYQNINVVQTYKFGPQTHFKVQGMRMDKEKTSAEVGLLVLPSTPLTCFHVQLLC